jgi:hypothetical protein
MPWIGENRSLVEPNIIIATVKVQPEESEEPEEGGHVFYSKLWANQTPLQFIVDSDD